MAFHLPGSSARQNGPSRRNPRAWDDRRHPAGWQHQRVGVCLAALVWLCACSALAQLDSTWMVTVNGVQVPVAADGSFRLPGVMAPDAYGERGPGTAPD